MLRQRLMHFCRRCLSYFGPGYLIAIGYMDPGNWQTDIESGSVFSYRLLWVIGLSNLMAVLLQFLAIRLGVLGRCDLAKACALHLDARARRSSSHMPRHVAWRVLKLSLYLLTEFAMMATDLAEIIGTAIALKMLFGLPLLYGVILTAFDVLFLLTGLLDTGYSGDANSQAVKPSDVLARRRSARFNGAKVIEIIILVLMTLICVCFFSLMAIIQPSLADILTGFFLPDVRLLWAEDRALFLALGIIGATVMPHNLYLHSYIVQARIPSELERMRTLATSASSTIVARADDDDDDVAVLSHTALPMASPSCQAGRGPADRADYYGLAMRNCLKYATIDSTVALFIALLINSAILITAAGGLNFQGQEHVADIMDAGALLAQHFGSSACMLFAVALLACGQSSTMTGTLAGQIVFEGFLDLKIRPWLRRLLTRGVAILPPILVTLVAGESRLNELLLISQVVLSFQLPFAIIPLIYFNWNADFLASQAEERRALLLHVEPGLSHACLDAALPLASQLPTDPKSQFADPSSSLLLPDVSFVRPQQQLQSPPLSHSQSQLQSQSLSYHQHLPDSTLLSDKPRLNGIVLALSLLVAVFIIFLNLLYLYRLAVYGDA